MDHLTGYQYTLTDCFRVRFHQHESIYEINGDDLDNKACYWSMASFSPSTELIAQAFSTALSIPKSFNLPLGLCATDLTHIYIHLHISH